MGQPTQQQDPYGQQGYGQGMYARRPTGGYQSPPIGGGTFGGGYGMGYGQGYNPGQGNAQGPWSGMYGGGNSAPGMGYTNTSPVGIPGLGGNQGYQPMPQYGGYPAPYNPTQQYFTGQGNQPQNGGPPKPRGSMPPPSLGNSAPFNMAGYLGGNSGAPSLGNGVPGAPSIGSGSPGAPSIGNAAQGSGKPGYDFGPQPPPQNNPQQNVTSGMTMDQWLALPPSTRAFVPQPGSQTAGILQGRYDQYVQGTGNSDPFGSILNARA